VREFLTLLLILAIAPVESAQAQLTAQMTSNNQADRMVEISTKK
jgi:hypothetical protein